VADRLARTCPGDAVPVYAAAADAAPGRRNAKAGQEAISLLGTLRSLHERAGTGSFTTSRAGSMRPPAKMDHVYRPGRARTGQIAARIPRQASKADHRGGSDRGA
jgi:hypothetical protein